MIKRFSVLYVGQIDLEDVGANGRNPDERRYSNKQLVQSFDHATALAKQMDESGFHCLWAAEHHFQREGYECIPNLTLLGVHLAAHTKNLKFGAAFNIVPMWHPLRLAEDFAMGDVLTGGRLGIRHWTWLPDPRGRDIRRAHCWTKTRTANCLKSKSKSFMKAFNQESFNHLRQALPDSTGRSLSRLQVWKDITLVPRPLNLPVEMWQPVTSGRSIDFIAKKGIKGMTALSGEKIVEQFFGQYKNCRCRGGQGPHSWDRIWRLGFGFYLADTVEEAVEPGPAHSTTNATSGLHPFGLVRYTDEQGRMWGSPGAPARTPTVEDGVQQKGVDLRAARGLYQYLPRA